MRHFLNLARLPPNPGMQLTAKSVTPFTEALVYGGAMHLLPKAEQEHKRYSFVALGGGILVAIIIILSKA